MAQKSMYWFTNAFFGDIGDGSAPYTQAEQRAHESSLLGEGVVAGVDNELSVSGLATPLAVATGRAQVAGFHYWNDASLNLAVTTPSVGTTGGRVVLRADWTTATTRAAILLNTDGVSAIPALTQTVGVTYEISLASFTVTTGGVIAVTDTRSFTYPNDALQLWRQGANVLPESWTQAGTFNFHVPGALIQFGAVAISAGGVGSVTYPKPYGNSPLVFIQLPSDSTFSFTSNDTTLTINDSVGSRTGYWLAIGNPA